jgi:hypothetical protein
VDDQLFVEQFENDVNFSLAPLLVAILKRVHYPFMDREANLVLIVFVESGGSGNSHTDFFGESNALDERFQDNFDPLRS